MITNTHELSNNHSNPNCAKPLLGDCAGFQSDVYLMDCITLMKEYPDNYFDLAVVDPPYGIGFSGYERGGMGKKVKERYTKNEKKKWDNDIPTIEYFTELFRVSKNQIIWGGNYFDLPPTQCFVFWYKQNPVPNFADGEMAWTSFKKPAVCFDFRYYGNLSGKTSASQKIHPTQKPTELYDWIFKNYASEGMKVLDTHLGSGSSRISANKYKLNFVGCEIDKEYFDKSQKRYDDFVSQVRLF